jgi:hypothetical protein
MTVKVPDGDHSYWTTTMDNVVLEFGGSYKQNVVAPVSMAKATVRIHTAFNPAGLKGMRFGRYVQPMGAGGGLFGSDWSPEPGKPDDRFSQFPVPGDGIKSVALGMRMTLTRDVKQPNGESSHWYWMRRDDYYADELMVTDESVIEFKEYQVAVTYELQDNQYFGNASGDKHGVQYLTFSDEQRAEAGNPLSLQFPTGKLECELKTFWGKATGDVIQALGLTPQAGREIWLDANLNPNIESAWAPRAIDFFKWNRGGGVGHPNLAYKTFSLESGKTQTIDVTSPDPTKKPE